MDAVALVVEQNFSQFYCCFRRLEHSSLPVATASDVARMHITSHTLDRLRELAALEGPAVLERLPRACVERQRRETAAAPSRDP